MRNPQRIGIETSRANPSGTSWGTWAQTAGPLSKSGFVSPSLITRRGETRENKSYDSWLRPLHIDRQQLTATSFVWHARSLSRFIVDRCAPAGEFFYFAPICGRALIWTQLIDKSSPTTCNLTGPLSVPLHPSFSCSVFPLPSFSLFFFNAIQSTVVLQRSLIARKYPLTTSLYGNSLLVLFFLPKRDNDVTRLYECTQQVLYKERSEHHLLFSLDQL